MTATCKPARESATDLIADFLRYFDVEFAATPAQRAAVYGVRYNVYCLEEQYERAEKFPDRMETDEYDEESLHCLITHRPSGIHAGCVRVVGAEAGGLLPFERHCPGSVEPEFFQAHDLGRDKICEISRLAVDGRFRRGSNERNPAFDREAASQQFSERELRTLPLIATACFLAATALTAISGQTNVFALMEPYLPRLMRRAGLRFQRAGHDVDYNGKRAPYFIRTQWAIQHLRPELRELYDAIYAQLASGYLQSRDNHHEAGHSGTPPWLPVDLLLGGAQQPAFT